MNYRYLKIFSILFVLFGLYSMRAQETTLEVDLSNSIAKIQPTMYGIFFEDINFAADGGLYAEMIKNRSFEFPDPMMGWLQPNSLKYTLNNKSGIAHVIKYTEKSMGNNYIRVNVKDDTGYSLINEGFRGMGIQKGSKYNLSLMAAKGDGDIKNIKIELIDSHGDVLGSGNIIPTSNNWDKYEMQLTAIATAAKAQLKITFEGIGTIDLDMVSVFPEDTWKGRKNGMRKDLVQLLADLNPGFLRFPGGCIVEGRTLAQRYQWKKTIGPFEQRDILVNRWNTEFDHRPAPDYYQSFGIGFFEYFQLAEDLGAAPLPILSCGVACQFNTGELVPLEELDPYVQDALDLIEFANGSVETPWGKVRRDMGHPETFNLKYIGIGNEQWGPEYIERYKIFDKAIKEKYPDIIIVSGSGPFPAGELYEYGMAELKKLNAEIVDEHYYSNPEWFRKNAGRYDNYDRQGPKIFAGEYAAQSVGTTSPENKNDWNCALSEAAFMTGLERNADIVHLTSYAPLLAHEEGWQWTPDLIWFNNLKSFGTTNYYVQKMFSTHAGTDLISITQNGKPLTGQKNLYASAVKDLPANQVFIKLINTSEMAKTLNIDLKGGGKIGKKVKIVYLQSDDLSAVNSFEAPKKISPSEFEMEMDASGISLELPPRSFYILNLKNE